MNIAQNIERFKSNIPDQVTLIAVSKTKPVSAILNAYQGGQRHFGENKVQEMVGKEIDCPKDILWHHIGHLQRNKVKYMASFVHMIHGIDSLKTLKEIEKQASKYQRNINCLIQVNISKEENKSGFAPEELAPLFNSIDDQSFKHLTIKGFMGMASHSSDENLICNEFKILEDIFNYYKTKYTQIDTLSMGMSGDYKLAIQSGSNMIRIGSALFGQRN